MSSNLISRSSITRRVEDHRRMVGMTFVVLLSALAGLTDTVGFLVTGDFVSFMSGNTTHLSVDIGKGDYWSALTTASWILLFILGNALGSVLSFFTQRRSWPLLVVIGCLLATTTWYAQHRWSFSMAVLAMGMINSVVEEVNGLPIGISYVTGALSRFGRGLGRWLTGSSKPGWRVQLIPWGGLLAGGVVGALLHNKIGANALGYAAASAFVLAAFSLAIPRRWQLRFMPK